MHDIIQTVNEWLRQGRQIALATVVDTWGSSPRQASARMAITADMAMVGSVSGGCVETAVVQEAVDCLATQRPRLLHYGVSDETAWNVGLACGGQMSIFVEPLDLGWWDYASKAVRDNHALTTVTILEGEGAGKKVVSDFTVMNTYARPTLTLEELRTLTQAALDSMESRRSQRLSADGLTLMVDVHRPPPRLVIVGGAHISVALHQFARQLGFRVVLIDPRRVFATPDRFPDLEKMLHSYPDQALTEIGMDEETYIAVLTHDPKIDDPALMVALPSEAPYVGVLSGKRSHEQRLERLRSAGLSDALLARLRTPIGLEINAKSPEEIALSVMAEIVAVRNGAALTARGDQRHREQGGRA
jgi:xanthine dehydrogenase accessory factor